jgi:hypothetical protein
MLPFTVAVAVSVLRSVPVQSHWPIDEHWRFRPPTLASSTAAEVHEGVSFSPLKQGLD